MGGKNPSKHLASQRRSLKIIQLQAVAEFWWFQKGFWIRWGKDMARKQIKSWNEDQVCRIVWLPGAELPVKCWNELTRFFWKEKNPQKQAEHLRTCKNVRVNLLRAKKKKKKARSIRKTSYFARLHWRGGRNTCGSCSERKSQRITRVMRFCPEGNAA